MIMKIILLIILIIIAGMVINLMLDIGSTFLRIAVHVIAGWILLTIVNFVPGIYIPINLITILISGFGGVIGTILLVIFYMLL